ncbi:conserved hypothetical protein [Ricinus communis]|uniref:Uncharacterized protein n=1 Tax=Ricinus communis TaxID=3988 RepID=B9T574_RICCO|nr:conserved hypothetical protein [Ricinus communis]
MAYLIPHTKFKDLLNHIPLLIGFTDSFEQAIWPHSGHYRPTYKNFKNFFSFISKGGKSVELCKPRLSRFGCGRLWVWLFHVSCFAQAIRVKVAQNLRAKRKPLGLTSN